MSSQESTNKDASVNETMKELVITRIDIQMPSNLRLSMGMNVGGLTKQQMIEHVRKGDEIGKKIVESHLRFLRAQASGELTTALASVE